MNGNGTKYVWITKGFVWIGVGLAGLFWIIESCVHVFIFHDADFIQQMLTLHPHEVWMRLIAVVMFIMFGIFAQFMMARVKQAEETTRLSHAELDQVFNTAADGMRVIDRDFNMLRSNKTFSKLSGMSKEEAVGKKCYEVFSGPYCHTPNCPLSLILGGEDRVECDIAKERHDGNTVPCIVTATPFKEHSGELKGIVENFKDITDRKQAEEALRGSEERYRVLIDTAREGVWAIDTDARTTFVNRQMAEMLGHAENELLGRKVFEFLDAENAAVFKEKLEKRRKGLSERYDLRFSRKDGSELWAIVNATPIFSNDGQVVGSFAMLTDVTDRKQLEIELKESEQRYRTLFENMPIVCFTFDKKGHFLSWNGAAEQVYGYTKKEAVGASAYDLIVTPMTKKYTHEVIERVFSGELIADSEWQDRNRKGEVGWRMGNAFPLLMPDGTVECGVNLNIDITERKLAEQALRKERDRAKQYLDIAGVMFVALDSDGNVTLINRKGCEVLGDKAEEVIGKNWFDQFIPERMREDTMAVFQSLMLGEIEPAEYFENPVVTKNGKEKIIAWHNTILKDDNGRIIVTLSSGEDITERKIAGEALRESEQRFRELADLLPVSVFELDVAGNFTYSNRCGFEMFGYTREDLEKGINALQLFIPEERQRVKQNIRKRLTGEEFEDHEYTALKKDGSTLTVLISTAAIIRDNKSVGVRGIVLDITERKWAEQALRESEERFRAMFEHMGSGVAVYEAADNGEDFIFRGFNSSAERITQIPRNAALGSRLLDLFPYMDRSGLLGALQRVWETGQSEHLPPFYYKDDIREGWRENRIFKLPSGEVVAIFDDVTKRKQAEEESKQSRQQLRDLAFHLQSVREEERTHIAREIHDDLGQALTALKLDIHWLANRLTEDQALLLEKTKLMSRLVDTTIHSVQRISSELRPGLLDDLGLSAAIEWQADEFENRTSMKCNISIDPEEIVLDRDLSTAIFRIFQEALTNIVRHANATRVEVSLKQKSDAIELKVRDNGIGITEEQISNPRSFGLIGMRERVHSFGGNLSISGTPNEGTTIMVGIPINKEE